MRTRHVVWTGTSDANVKLTEYITTCSGVRSQYGAIAMQSRQVSGLAPKTPSAQARASDMATLILYQ